MWLFARNLLIGQETRDIWGADMSISRRGLAATILAAGLSLAPIGAMAQERVSVGVLRFVSSGSLFLAHERGYFKQEGLDIDLKFFEAAQPIAVAVVSGDADFGLTAFTAGFFNLAGKGALKVIAAQAKEARGFEGNAILASRAAAEKGFDDIAKFPGRSLAITQLGSSFHYQIGQLARIKDFDVRKVDLKPLQSLPNMVAALKSGQVDSIIVAPHIAKPLIASGDAKLLGWYSDFNEYQFGALFTATKTASDRRPLTEKFVRAYQKGAQDYANAFLKTDTTGKRVFDAGSDEAAKSIAKHVYPGEAAETAIEKVKASAIFVDSQARLDVQDIYNQVAWYKAQGLIDVSVDPKSFLDLTFVQGHFNLPK